MGVIGQVRTDVLTRARRASMRSDSLVNSWADLSRQFNSMIACCPSSRVGYVPPFSLASSTGFAFRGTDLAGIGIQFKEINVALCGASLWGNTGLDLLKVTCYYLPVRSFHSSNNLDRLRPKYPPIASTRFRFPD